MNPIINQMALGKINPQQVKAIWNNLQNAADPSKMINQMLRSNPQIATLLKYNTPQEAFYGLAKEKGIDPDAILNMLK